MRIAMPVWRGRVAPVFDWAGTLLIAEEEKGTIVSSAEESIAEMPPQARPRRLSELGVELLICGGISRWMSSTIAAAGIACLSGVAGNAREVLDAHAAGRLNQTAFAMPGWRGGRRRRFRGGRR